MIGRPITRTIRDNDKTKTAVDLCSASSNGMTRRYADPRTEAAPINPMKGANPKGGSSCRRIEASQNGTSAIVDGRPRGDIIDGRALSIKSPTTPPGRLARITVRTDQSRSRQTKRIGKGPYC